MLNNDLQNQNLPAGGDAPVAPASAEYRKKAEKAAEQFEAQFVREMFKQMRKTTREVAGEDSVFANSINGDMMDLADGALADQLAHQRIFGVANAILAQLLPADGNIAIKPPADAVASQQQGHDNGQGLAAFATPMFPLNK
ncbi:rod-binding protein [Chromobacterium subtsugae]|uniref:Rod-binding protein n=1 Tax=Chromobacterium subtsugae TaxID=251747 RepID=A0ABS7FBI7_9NEIS|nr:MULTISPECIES: rod-binding protein [Chromobacterium]KUM01675.1 flagellar biosynthesis protein FlgJ [Chromobacterium subtsugae]KZE84548.1 flagellar biosynthesis protein FlgJ [Chromobacterium sp. F49]MBW7566241.1 rod-binding protein [Chromobacterium subtsugae]MBW8287362.1 rod-binding protein [Chromobacterium subtsugae]OBU87501.1 flagellar rod assembly protein FlgJ [Chromobacterium subtsugae]